MKVRIKKGAKVGQDFGFFDWPGCKPPLSEFAKGESYQYRTQYPDAIFEAEMEEDKKSVICRRKGYGKSPDYGNGAVYVDDLSGVEVIKSDKDMTVLEIIIDWLKSHDYSGLITDGCGCPIDELFICDCDGSDGFSCQPGYAGKSGVVYETLELAEVDGGEDSGNRY